MGEGGGRVLQVVHSGSGGERERGVGSGSVQQGGGPVDGVGIGERLGERDRERELGR